MFADGTLRTGTLDASGYARLQGIPPGPADVFYGEDARAPALQPVVLHDVNEQSLASDLRRLGLDPATLDLQALVERQAGRAQ
jgi:type VI secretion system secreted protein VgrG